MQRYFINKTQINNNIVTINESDTHHIKNVMRMSIGDNVYVCDNINAYLCEIVSINEITTLRIVKQLENNPELSVNITIAQGKLQREKEEMVIKALTQLGCYQYIGVQMSKSIVKTKKITDNKIDRIQKIIKEASEQSQRNRLMKYVSNITFKELISNFVNYDLVIFCDIAESKNVTLKELLSEHKYKNILAIIGPESGFSKLEKDAIKNANALTISLGKRILRTEIAPLFLLSAISYEEEL